MLFVPKRISALRLTLMCAVAGSTAAVAQTGQDPAAVLRNIEQAQPKSPELPAIERVTAPPTTSSFSIDKLIDIRIDSRFLSQDIQAYWLPFVQKPVSANEIAQFKAWMWEQLQAEGYLAYVITSEEKVPGGSVLVIQVRAPTLGKISVVANGQREGLESPKSYADIVAQRFSKAYNEGAPVDVQGMTAKLNSISYDLPVVLEAVLRQPNAETIDVLIQMRLLKAGPGRFNGGLVQANNYGLKDYGREQLLTQVRLHGLTALSEFTFTGQISEGVRYLKTEAMTPLIGWNSRAQGWLTWVDSESLGRPVERVQGQTRDFGLGIHSLLSSTREGTVTSALEWGQRSTNSEVANTLQSDRKDRQFKAQLSTQKSLRWLEHYSADISLHLGQVDIQDAADVDDRRVQGHYQKWEFNGQARKTLSADKKWVSAVRWRSQTADKNLDGYNQLSLGGVNGIRAYTSSDGVGDQGFQVSLDLTRQVSPHLFLGVLYDVGRVKQNIQRVGTEHPAAYTLSGAGFQAGGDHGSINWIGTLARGLDKSEPFETAVSSDLQAWRGSIAVNYSF